MSEFLMAQKNNRNIPMEDKIFGISRQAHEMMVEKGEEAVTNGTIGALLDDEGKLVVLSSVVEVLRTLSPTDYAEYAPIGGTEEFRKYIKKAAFGDFEPSGFAEAVATPGGTGAIRNTIMNYSCPGDKILTSDWFWANYSAIAAEAGRELDTFKLFDEKGDFNVEDFKRKVEELSRVQESITIIVNTPAHNPTGYTFSLEDWDKLLDVLKSEVFKDKKIALLVDVAYIDFAGDSRKYREFFPKLDNLPRNILPIVAYSLSKTYTLYGMRCGAMICMTQEQAIAEEFVRVSQFSGRAAWSNCIRAGMVVLTRIYEDEVLMRRVTEEREHYCEVLNKRGAAFAEEAKRVGLEIVPFDSGFFVSVPCENPDAAVEVLKKEGIFLVPLTKGIRVSLASITEERCRKLPERILYAIRSVD